MRQTRPVNLNLFTIRFPLPAIISILHRITGVLLFLLVPVLLWTLSYSLNETGFNQLQIYFSNPFVKFFVWLCLIPLCFHLTAGIRHLLMDVHIGTRLDSGRMAAALTLVVSITLVILTGIWLW